MKAFKSIEKNQDIEKILGSAHRHCVKTSVRLTPKRERVLRVILTKKTPLSAYEIIEEYREAFNEILPAMTAYRILNFLIENGLIHRLQTCNLYLACEHIQCDHLHETPQFLICDKCHSVKEMPLANKIISEFKKNAESIGFLFHRQQVELYGLCQTCQ